MGLARARPGMLPLLTSVLEGIKDVAVLSSILSSAREGSLSMTVARHARSSSHFSLFAIVLIRTVSLRFYPNISVRI